MQVASSLSPVYALPVWRAEKPQSLEGHLGGNQVLRAKTDELCDRNVKVGPSPNHSVCQHVANFPSNIVTTVFTSRDCTMNVAIGGRRSQRINEYAGPREDARVQLALARVIRANRGDVLALAQPSSLHQRFARLSRTDQDVSFANDAFEVGLDPHVNAGKASVRRLLRAMALSLLRAQVSRMLNGRSWCSARACQ